MKKGTMKKNYHEGREKKLTLKYSLKRRGDEVIKAIKKYHPSNINAILDVGTADGLMLSRVKKNSRQLNASDWNIARN